MSRLPAPLLAASLLLAGSQAAAVPVHAPFGNYSVELDPSATIAPIAGFNGSTTAFQGFGVQNFMPLDQTFSFTEETRTLRATFLADPGFVFTGVSLGFGQWSYAWIEGSGIGVTVDWLVPGGVFASGNSPNNPGPTCTTNTIGTFRAGSGSSGCFQLTEGFATQGGGGNSFLRIAGDANPNIVLNDVASFTVDIDVTLWAGGRGFFGDRMTSAFGFSSFDVTALTVPGTPAPPPPSTGVPEPATLLLALAGLSAAATIRPRRPARTGDHGKPSPHA